MSGRRFVPYRLRVWWLSRDPRRAVICGDLDCMCETCTTPWCPCATRRNLVTRSDPTPPPDDDALLAVYQLPIVQRIAAVLWGSHQRAAKASHRPGDVERLFCDANASMMLAAAIYVQVLKEDA